MKVLVNQCEATLVNVNNPYEFVPTISVFVHRFVNNTTSDRVKETASVFVETETAKFVTAALGTLEPIFENSNPRVRLFELTKVFVD